MPCLLAAIASIGVAGALDRALTEPSRANAALAVGQFAKGPGDNTTYQDDDKELRYHPKLDENLKMSNDWMHAGLDGQSFVLGNETVDAKDCPSYRECGQIMNHAWREANDRECSHGAYEASHAMRDAVPRCSELHQGKRYKARYRELLRDQDAWCGQPCKHPCPPGHGCKRDVDFPYEPMCRSGDGALRGEGAKSSKDAACPGALGAVSLLPALWCFA